MYGWIKCEWKQVIDLSEVINPRGGRGGGCAGRDFGGRWAFRIKTTFLHVYRAAPWTVASFCLQGRCERSLYAESNRWRIIRTTPTSPPPCVNHEQLICIFRPTQLVPWVTYVSCASHKGLFREAAMENNTAREHVIVQCLVITESRQSQSKRTD